MSDAVGAMRARISFERSDRVADEIGGAALAWSDQGEAWAEIEAQGASSGAGFDATAASAAFRVTVHRRSDVRAGWRVRWGARTLRIIGVADDQAPRMILSCVEQRP